MTAAAGPERPAGPRAREAPGIPGPPAPDRAPLRIDAPRWLAIVPPDRAPTIASIPRWLEAGLRPAQGAVLLRPLPSAHPAPAALADLAREARAAGLAVIGSAASAPSSWRAAWAELAALLPPSRPAGLARIGLQIRGDPPDAVAEALQAAPIELRGRSVHGPAPPSGPGRWSYSVLAPIHPPRTPKLAGASRPPLGLEALGAWVRARPEPVLALGGIGPDRIGPCLAAGAHGVAGIAGFFGDPGEVAETAAALAEALHAARAL